MKILVVDDSKTMRYVLVSQLKELGYSDIEEADCVEKAKALAIAAPPTLIISDWNMPGGVSGLDFLKFIRSTPRTSEIPFVILTTDSDRSKIVDATKAGVQSFLLKPIKKDILVEKLHEIAAAYGFTPPTAATSKPHVAPALPPMPLHQNEAPHPLKGKLKGEMVPKIIEILAEQWGQAVNLETVKDFFAKEVFISETNDAEQNIDAAMELLLSAALDGIKRRLAQLV